MQINFEFETVYGRYCDTLNLPDDHTFKDEAIQDMKQQRVDKWLEFMSVPPQNFDVINVEAQFVDEVV